MKHNIKAIEISLTPAISDYLEKKIAYLDKFISPEISETVMCYVEIGKSTQHHKNGDFFVAELTLHIGGKSLRAKAEKDDLYIAIDAVTDEMSEELKSYKDRKTSLVKRSGAKLKGFIRGFYSE